MCVLGVSCVKESSLKSLISLIVAYYTYIYWGSRGVVY